MAHDLSLMSGERQVATEYGAIRRDHQLRYEWANQRLAPSGFGADLFCGNGYGTWLLSQGRVVLGVDGSSEAIALAQQHYQTPGSFFATQYYPFNLPTAAFDFVVSLESVEHVEDGASFFAAMVRSLKVGGLLVFSTPNEDCLPLASTGNHFHYRHYTLQQTLALAASPGLELLDWAGQDTYTFTPEGRQGSLLPESVMELKARTPGQFLVVLARRV